MKKVISIEGMSCNHCVKHITNALKEVEGIKKVEVSLKGQKAIVDVLDFVPDSVLIETVEDAGYDVIGIK